MKKIMFLFLCFTVIFSCENDSKIEGEIKRDSYFRITEFIISENSIDLNNDNIMNTNMFLEFLNYFNSTYDLQIKTNKNSSLLSFYLPKQNIFFDYLCCPNGYVEFSKNGFTINMNRTQTRLENQIIDNENKVILFSKLNDSSYKLILEKKYFDFNSNSLSAKIYEIKYDMIN
ncbi:hypothetical protein ABH942_002745 [Flavobacterium sp. 28YEA47A]|uniref:hypothetical protein n=1 Tax=Flavobacterium sp. 28YEA47A TaxID=3156276 RepID=UPI0035159F88